GVDVAVKDVRGRPYGLAQLVQALDQARCLTCGAEIAISEDPRRPEPDDVGARAGKILDGVMVGWRELLAGHQAERPQVRVQALEVMQVGKAARPDDHVQDRPVLLGQAHDAAMVQQRAGLMSSTSLVPDPRTVSRTSSNVGTF